MPRICFSAVIGAFLLIPIASADEPKPAELSETDCIRLAEAFRLAEAIGNRVWPDWDKAPFGVLLVTPDYEFLVNHPKPSDDFTPLGEDARLRRNVWRRKRQFNPKFLATFPAVGGIPTIVIGQAENTTAKASTHWVITLLHEHFHQLQYSHPRYQVDVHGLGLARGDQTGMWMLNYPFPYSEREVTEQFGLTCQTLADAMRSRSKPEFPDKLSAYVSARRKLNSLLKPDDHKYLAFQSWQEGIARYTEYRLAELAAADYKPTKDYRELPDFIPFDREATAILEGIEKELTSMRLERNKREIFYAFGAAEGLVLDRANPDWRRRYFEEKFAIDQYLPGAK
jgi:hypothetical protein